MYTDNTHKFTIVLDKKQPTAVQMNALGHLVAGLVDIVGGEAPGFLEYDFSNTEMPPSRISTHPVIVLVAPNGSQVQKVWENAVAAGLAANCFTTSMLGISAEAQRRATRETAYEDLGCVAVALFGAAAEIDPLTRKFSVLR